MNDLKQTLELLGLARVETYIQSGNVIFESDEAEESLRRKLESEIEKTFGVTTVVILRTSGELEKLIHACPFSQAEIAEAQLRNTEGESLYVSLLSHDPDSVKAEKLNSIKCEGDEFRIIDRDIYILLQRSIRNSKLAGSIDKLGAPSTVRNWKTLNKLMALAESRTTK
ncbi:hypothetical protein SDC9_140828 [bioreactor metagenome]|uniref:DUF1697 domain-containing protein n=1 Tax=bioreactor metagenome TaxID=1076179 RepID=A0A645DWH7_9ZZZZ